MIFIHKGNCIDWTFSHLYKISSHISGIYFNIEECFCNLCNIIGKLISKEITIIIFDITIRSKYRRNLMKFSIFITIHTSNIFFIEIHITSQFSNGFINFSIWNNNLIYFIFFNKEMIIIPIKRNSIFYSIKSIFGFLNNLIMFFFGLIILINQYQKIIHSISILIF